MLTTDTCPTNKFSQNVNLANTDTLHSEGKKMPLGDIVAMFLVLHYTGEDDL